MNTATNYVAVIPQDGTNAGAPPTPCPHCGYCPTCKRAATPAPYWPYQPYWPYRPYWIYQPTTWSGTVTHSPGAVTFTTHTASVGSA